MQLLFLLFLVLLVLLFLLLLLPLTLLLLLLLLMLSVLVLLLCLMRLLLLLLLFLLSVQAKPGSVEGPHFCSSVEHTWGPLSDPGLGPLLCKHDCNQPRQWHQRNASKLFFKVYLLCGVFNRLSLPDPLLVL